MYLYSIFSFALSKNWIEDLYPKIASKYILVRNNIFAIFPLVLPIFQFLQENQIQTFLQNPGEWSSPEKILPSRVLTLI